MNRCHLLWLSLVLASPAAGQQLVDWTESPGPLGLGYPVPEAQDTPLPFDGFRSYAGLHARHQQMLLDNDTVSGTVVGSTAHGRDIWMYRFGDPEAPDVEGRPRAVMLINGGIHAREWQSPEVVTGLLELLVDGQGDNHWLSYLRDNVDILTIPVQNIDGLLQTQRYPRSNYLGSDPTTPMVTPRDGRMRRKNMFQVDEDLATVGDHLNGIDLNRNNLPFWASPPGTANPLGLIYRGMAPGSEPESLALYAAAEQAPGERLRLFVDVHSFSRVFFSTRTSNNRRNRIQAELLAMVSDHHMGLPGGKRYLDIPGPIGQGIGATDEYFGYTYEIPSLTWEIEPGGSAGVEYGGFGSNGHSGFILPESQIRRVRGNVAKSLAAAAYRMAGPPHLQRLRVIDEDSGALILDRHWRATGSGVERVLVERQLRALELGRPYRVWLAFNKPMRWRDDAGDVTVFPGQPQSSLAVTLDLRVNTQALTVQRSTPEWAHQSGAAPDGYLRYRDDALGFRLVVADDDNNRNLLQNAAAQSIPAHLVVDVADMTGQRMDSDPGTAVDWHNGAWSGYENVNGLAGDSGGSDRTQIVPVSLQAQEPPFPVSEGHSAGWHDPARSGEGFLLENIDGERAVVYWFTYDNDGEQRWLNGVGRIEGNRIRFPELFVTRGGRFGPDFDPDLIEREVVASGEFWFSGCTSGWFDYRGFGQEGRFELVRTSHTMAIDCAPLPGAVSRPEAGQSGSWYDPEHNGEGFAIQWLSSDAVLLMWFSYDPDGRQYWMVGTGKLEGEEIVMQDLHATRGARFGAGFDPGDVERFFWGDLRLRLGCQQGEAHYDSVVPGFGSGSFQLQRLTSLHGLSCGDQGPGR